MGTAAGRWVLFTTVLGSGLVMIDGTVVNVALDRIGPVETSNGVPDQRARLRGPVGRAPVRPAGH